jgi:hypothetical protein
MRSPGFSLMTSINTASFRLFPELVCCLRVSAFHSAHEGRLRKLSLESFLLWFQRIQLYQR